MACMKLGSKVDTFQRQGKIWFCTTGLPSDVTVEVGDVSFHLHKFPLLSKSALLEKLIADKSNEQSCIINLPDLPGGSKAFELVAKFCYGMKIELTSSNVVYARCAAEHLQMTEQVSEGNLISKSEAFINQSILRSWRESLKVLQTCDDLLPPADDLNIVKRCIDSLTSKASTDPDLFGWPMTEHRSLQSPGGSLLWNGINIGARPRIRSSDWWYDDVSCLSLRLYKRLISEMVSRGIGAEIIAGTLSSYAKRFLPGLNKRHNATPTNSTPLLSEEEQRNLLEEIVRLLPDQKGAVSTKFLFGLLRTAMIVKASSSCLSELERRIGMQLDEASLDDLLIPNFSNSLETLYDVDCVLRILKHFVAMDQNTTGGASPGALDDEQLMSSPSLAPITAVAKLMDGYLAEIAPDVNLKLPKFQALAAAVPEYARLLDDGLYRAIDIYFKAHPWLSESDREQLCRLMDCQKLSLEACTHATQNERLPLRVIVQVLFFEQLQLRTSIAGCFLVSGNLDGSRQLRSGLGAAGDGGGWASAVRENQVLKVGLDHMRMRVSELEKECSNMRHEIERLVRKKSAWSDVTKIFSTRVRSQMCSTREDPAGEHRRSGSGRIEGSAKARKS